MPLSKDLVSQFVKSTKDNDKKNNKETFVTGELVKKENGQYWAKIYGSEQLTPVTIPTNVSRTKPVNIMIKNHTAHVIGNISTDADNSYEDSGDIFNDTSSGSSDSIWDGYIEALWSDYLLPTKDETVYIYEDIARSEDEDPNDQGLYTLPIDITFGDEFGIKKVKNVAIYDRAELVTYCTDYRLIGDWLEGIAYVPERDYSYTIMIKYTKNS